MSKIIGGAKDAVKQVAAGFGFGGGAGEAKDYASDPEAYKDLYEKALAGINGVGGDADSLAQRKSLNGALQGQLDDLGNHAAGRKQNFMEDSARGFSADTQNIARARGGTGTLTQALSTPGAMYDAHARAESRGLNDLYSQATQDLGNLQGVQGNLYNQDMSKATNAANVYQRELDSRRGTNTQNLENQWNAQQGMYGRQQKTYGMLLETAKKGGSGGAGGAGGAAAGGA